MHRDNVRMIPDALFQNAEQSDFALERTHPVSPKTKLKHLALLQRLMAAHPDFSEYALPDLAFEDPLRVRDGLAVRRTPAEHRLFFHRDEPLRFVRVLRRQKTGQSRLAHFA